MFSITCALLSYLGQWTQIPTCPLVIEKRIFIILLRITKSTSFHAEGSSDSCRPAWRMGQGLEEPTSWVAVNELRVWVNIVFPIVPLV